MKEGALAALITVYAPAESDLADLLPGARVRVRVDRPWRQVGACETKNQ